MNRQEKWAAICRMVSIPCPTAKAALEVDKLIEKHPGTAIERIDVDKVCTECIREHIQHPLLDYCTGFNQDDRADLGHHPNCRGLGANLPCSGTGLVRAEFSIQVARAAISKLGFYYTGSTFLHRFYSIRNEFDYVEGINEKDEDNPEAIIDSFINGMYGFLLQVDKGEKFPPIRR